MTATVEQMIDELVGLVKQAPSIKKRGFSVFNLEELFSFVDTVGFPLAGVTYEGTSQKENSIVGQPRNRSAIFLTAYFTIAIGVNYKYASETDTKPIATNLLDEVRGIVLGYSGVNNRPWKLTGETPVNADIEGAIFYGQTWETDLPVIGNSSN